MKTWQVTIIPLDRHLERFEIELTDTYQRVCRFADDVALARLDNEAQIEIRRAFPKLAELN